MNRIFVKVKVECAASYCRNTLEVEVPIKEELEIDSVPTRVDLLDMREEAFTAVGWQWNRHAGWVCAECRTECP